MSVLAVGALLLLMSSCKKDCTCTITYSDKTKETFTEFPENYNAKNCKQLADQLAKMTDVGETVSCK